MVAEADNSVMEVSSLSQFRIPSIILPDSSETSIIVEVRLSWAFDTSVAIPAVSSADWLMAPEEDEMEVLICSRASTFDSSVKSMELICITASMVFVTACSNSFLPFTSL